MTDHQALAKAHLMLHFSDMAAYAERPIPIIERGEGCHVFDDAGNRYIDGLSGLYCTNLGHSHGDELGRAARGADCAGCRSPATGPWRTRARLSSPRGSRTSRPPASTGCSSPRGAPRPWSRPGSSPSSTTRPRASPSAEGDRPQGRLSRGSRSAPSRSRGSRCAATRSRRRPCPSATSRTRTRTATPRATIRSASPARCSRRWTPRSATRAGDGRDADCRAGAERRRLAGPAPGYWQGLREICDRHGVLLCSDEVICAFGRLGYWFGAEAFGYAPDLITFVKGSPARTSRSAAS